MFRAVDIIIKKRNGGALSDDEIKFFIEGVCNNTIPEYQLSAFLMAVFFQGMTFEETGFLTRAMIKSGEIYDLSSIPGAKVDKHSTGGVGDKISLILAPLAAACGVTVPMVSGRGLGHTGGTLDKLISIPGYRFDLTQQEFIEQLKKLHGAIIGQSATFVPADKKLYAMRDVTGTVESIPLITASILSKKFASGTDAIVMDVKCGSGAFMDTYESAEKLAVSLVKTGESLGRKVIAMLTDMNQPMGKAVGNSNEVIESIETLKGKGPKDVEELTFELCAEMMIIAGVAKDKESAMAIIREKVANGEAVEKFRQIIKMQHGDPRVIDDYSLLEVSPDMELFKADKDGYIKSFNTRKVGNAGMLLGGGRLKIEDVVDIGVGFIFHKRIGDKVSKGETIAEIYHRKGKNLESASELLREAIVIDEQKTEPPPLVWKIIK